MKRISELSEDERNMLGNRASIKLGVYEALGRMGVRKLPPAIDVVGLSEAISENLFAEDVLLGLEDLTWGDVADDVMASAVARALDVDLDAAERVAFGFSALDEVGEDYLNDVIEDAGGREVVESGARRFSCLLPGPVATGTERVHTKSGTHWPRLGEQLVHLVSCAQSEFGDLACETSLVEAGDDLIEHLLDCRSFLPQSQQVQKRTETIEGFEVEL